MSREIHFSRKNKDEEATSVTRQASWLHVLLSWSCAAVSVGVILFVVFSIYRTLPVPLSSEKAGKTQFSEQRARVHLDYLVKSIGTRHFGSDTNHHTTKSYLIRELEKMKATANSSLKIDILVDDRPGYTRFRNLTHMWESMDNVILVIHGEKEDAMLVSAHYDTVSLSAGATDNTAAVSALMELANVIISSSEYKPRYTLILAFVQGEEIGLLGAAALAEFWPPFSKIVHFLNLDGTPGDKSMNFRSSGGYLDRIYANVKWPLGFVTAMDIFNLKLIGSDTDWSVYTRYRSGLDYATFSKRQTYHTLKDITITSGSIQFLGDNMLGLVSKAINDVSPWQLNDRTPHVFYSILNIVHVVYTMETAHWIHLGAVSVHIGAFIIVFISRTSYHFRAFSSGHMRLQPTTVLRQWEHPMMSMAVGAIYVLGTVISAILFPTAFSIVSSFYAQMYSYTRTSLAVAAIIFPSLVGICVAQFFIHLWEKSRVSLELSRHRFFWGTAVVWLLVSILALKISSTVGSTYFISFFTVASTLSLLLHHLYSLSGLLHASVPCLVSASKYRPRRGRIHINVSPENDDLEEDMRQNETVNSILHQIPPEPSFLMTELLWLSLFLVQLFPISFIFEILAPLMELAIGALGAAVFGPLIGISVLLALLGFIPLSRRGGHYGKLCVIFFILALLTFVPITIYGRSAFNSDYPYVLEPRQVEDRIEVRSYMPYSVDIKSMVQVLDASLNWTCEKDNRLCSAPNTPQTFSSLSATCPESSSTVTLVLKTPGAWMHIITFGEVVPVKNIKLNGIEMKTLERNFGIVDFALDDNLRMQPFRFYLNSTKHTSSWHISFERDTSGFSQESQWRNNLNVTVESIWAESTSVPLVHRWMSEGKMPSWMSLVGLGMKGLASHSVTSYPCV